jgi:transposase
MKKTYTEEFKLTIVKLAESGQPTKVLSEEYGICKSTINAWRRSYKRNASGKVAKELSADEKRIRELEKQLKDAQLERDILKKAVCIFSRRD